MPPNIAIADQGCREAKNVENHWPRQFFIVLKVLTDSITCETLMES